MGIMSNLRYVISSLLVVFGWMTLVQPGQALTVDSFDCSGIDVTDGNTEDWENIPDLINTEDSVTGTTFYLDSDSNEWTNIEPADWQYSANLEQQANIQQMKVCNTDTFFLMLRTEEPMMFFYDKEQDSFIDFWNTYEVDGEFENFTLPADYHYWMVWKMQAADGSGSIIYFAADLTMEAGRVLNNDSDEADRVPTLYLYKETTAVSYDEATFDPTTDEELTTIALSDDTENVECDGTNNDPACDPEPVDQEFYAFEVSQDISELFTYADFSYGDTINMTAAMYNSDQFGVSSVAGVLSLVDETDTQEYTFSKQAVRDLHPAKNSLSDKRITLKWDNMKTANAYQIKLINPNNDKVIDLVRGIKDNQYTIRGLDAGTTYRAIVRAVIRKNGQKRFSAWSSGYKWTTNQ